MGASARLPSACEMASCESFHPCCTRPRAGQEAAAVRRHDLTGDPEPAAGKRNHTEIDEVVASARRADGAAHDALDPRAQGTRAGAPDRVVSWTVSAVRRSHITRSRFLSGLPESHRTR